jgi:2-methylcitrate dehydratase
VIGPLVPGGSGGPHGARVPGTSLVLDPCAAAFSTGALVAWLGYNDAWLAAEWCAPHSRVRAASQPALTPLAVFQKGAPV